MSNFQPLDVVGRCSKTQLQVGENLNKLSQQDKGKIIICKLCNPIRIIFKMLYINTYGIAVCALGARFFGTGGPADPYFSRRSFARSLYWC